MSCSRLDASGRVTCYLSSLHMCYYIFHSDVNRWLEGMTVFWNFNLIKILFISVPVCVFIILACDMTERQLLT